MSIDILVERPGEKSIHYALLSHGKFRVAYNTLQERPIVLQF